MSVDYSIVLGVLGLSIVFLIRGMLTKKEYFETTADERNDFQYIEYKVWNLLSLMLLLMLAFILPELVTINDVNSNYTKVIAILNGFSMALLGIFLLPIMTIIWSIVITGLKSVEEIMTGSNKEEKYDD